MLNARVSNDLDHVMDKAEVLNFNENRSEEDKPEERFISRFRACRICTKTMIRNGIAYFAAKKACDCVQFASRNIENDSVEELDEKRMHRSKIRKGI